MAKIGRNAPCPCGSGLKHKKCCLEIASKTGNQPARQEVNVAKEVSNLQNIASEMQASMKVVGFFIFFSTQTGDAWLLESTEQDAIQVSANGKKLPVEIFENEEEISIKWSHKFKIKENILETTSYADGTVHEHTDYPISSIKTELERKC